MDDFINYKVDISNKDFDILVEWLRSHGFDVQVVSEVPQVKAEDVQMCPMPDPDSTIMFSPLVYTDN